MTNESSEHLLEIAAPVRRLDICAPSVPRRIAAMLDIDASPILANGTLPRGWHFPLLAGETRRSELRHDGFPGFGIPMPDLNLPRLLLLGRMVEFLDDIPIGASIECQSSIEKLQQKETATGSIAIVTLRHELTVASSASPAIIETQNYMLLGAAKKAAAVGSIYELPAHAVLKAITADETILFQYSALGFNSHKIHLDRAHASGVEGLPDLVVNGGLITLLLSEFLRVELGDKPKCLRTKHLAPLFCGQPMTVAATRDGGTVRLLALNHAGVLATEMEAEVI